MGKIMVMAICSLALLIPSGATSAEDEKARVDLKKQSVTVPEDMFIEKTPKSRGDQILGEAVMGGANGMLDAGAKTGVAAIAGTVLSGGTAAPISATAVAASAVGGGVVGAIKGAYKGATEPTEYNEFDKTKINQALQDRGTSTNYRR